MPKLLLKMGTGSLGIGLLLFFAPDSIADGLHQWALIAIGGVSLFISFLRWAIKQERANAKQRQEELDLTKRHYETTLRFLQSNPEDPQARVSCLEAGRRYYELVMPDTHTVHYRNGLPVGTSDAQDNSAGREARISSDIEARVGHLKVKKAA